MSNNNIFHRTRDIVVIVLAFMLCIFTFSCTKSLKVDPPISGLASGTVYSENSTAASAVTGIYDQMSNTGLTDGIGSISLQAGLSADELTNYLSNDPVLPGLYTNSLNSMNNYFWPELYAHIYAVNAAIEGVTSSEGLTPLTRQQLMGETKFTRAFLYFYATNLYGDVPLVTTTDYRANNVIKRSPVADVYQQMITDLKDAQINLSDNFLTPSGLTTTERVRPNKGAATALLARVYLYSEKYDSAESQASAVIDNPNYSLLANLDSVFLTNSNEAIWQFQSVVPGINTYDASNFVIISPPGQYAQPVSLSNNLYNAFEPGDSRSVHWVGSYTVDTQTFYYPNKYKVYLQNQPLTEYTMVLRLAEQYLIRAEARAQQNNISGALADLNVIRTRAGLANYSGLTDQTSLIQAILHERRVELFTEWGHRWFDLKRTQTINSVMGAPGNITLNKGGTWSANAALFPIPISEILLNGNLSQNPGYH